MLAKTGFGFVIVATKSFVVLVILPLSGIGMPIMGIFCSELHAVLT
jgi:hypothetical protein